MLVVIAMANRPKEQKVFNGRRRWKRFRAPLCPPQLNHEALPASASVCGRRRIAILKNRNVDRLPQHRTLED